MVRMLWQSTGDLPNGVLGSKMDVTSTIDKSITYMDSLIKTGTAANWLALRFNISKSTAHEFIFEILECESSIELNDIN